MIILRILFHCPRDTARAIECDAKFPHHLFSYLSRRGHFRIRKKSREIPIIILDRLHTSPSFYLDVFEKLALEGFEVGGHSQIVSAILCDTCTAQYLRDFPTHFMRWNLYCATRCLFLALQILFLFQFVRQI